MKRIEVCGNIASGKTSLVKAFQKNDYNVLFEDVNEMNILNDFYKMPNRYAFETELILTLQHYHKFKRYNYFAISDFSLITDYAFALSNLSKEELKAYQHVYNQIIKDVDLPGKIIRIRVSNETILERIRTRGRENETKITKEYLSFIDDNIEKIIHERFQGIKIHYLDTDKIPMSQYDCNFIRRIIE